MKKELYEEIDHRMNQICDVFAALEFTYRNYDSSKDAIGAISIIGVCTHSGMAAFENLRNAIDKAEIK